MSVRLRILALGLGAAGILAGCYSLDVPDTSGLTRDAVFNDPLNIQATIATVYANITDGMLNALPWGGLSAQTLVITTSSDVNQMWALAQEPRVVFNNAGGQGTTNGPQQSYPPWHRFWEGVAYSADALREIKERHSKIIDPVTGADNTTRSVVFGKFDHALSTMYLGMMWDKSPIVGEETWRASDLTQGPPPAEFHPHQEVFDSGVSWMQEVISIMDTATAFVLPRNQLWIYGQQIPSSDFARIIKSYLARSMVYNARTPAERAAVNWATVKSLIQTGGIVQDFGPGGYLRPNGFSNLGYYALTNSDVVGTTGTGGDHDNTNLTRINLRLIGPGDTTGRFQTWLTKVDQPGRDTVTPVIIGSPDRRIQNGGTTANPGDGTLFRFTASRPPDNTGVTGMPQSRGKYYYTNYYSTARVSNNPAGCNRVGNNECMWSVQTLMITVDEMNLLLAEAEYRLGNLQAAADLINLSRTRSAALGGGELPAVTTSGPPPGPSCVPRRYDNSCGDLFDALVYERRIQLFGREGIIDWGDIRGFGCMLEGSLLEMPVPANDLILSGVPVYTLGGVGLPGGAPVPTNCPLMVNPTVRGHG